MNRRNIFIAIILISMLACGLSIYDRMTVEADAKAVDVVLDFYEMDLLAKQMEMETTDMFAEFKSFGARTVALEEESLFSMVRDGKDLSYGLIGKIKGTFGWEELLNEESVDYLKNFASPYDMIVRTADESVAEEIFAGLESRYSDNFYQVFESKDMTVFVIHGTADDVYYSIDNVLVNNDDDNVKRKESMDTSRIEDIGLGFDPEKVEAIQSSGLNVNLRPKNYKHGDSKQIDAYFSDVDKYSAVPEMMIFSGKDALGFGYDLDLMFKYLEKYDISLGLIETGVQRDNVVQYGADELLKMRNYDAVRIFPMVDYIQERYKYYSYDAAEEIENTMYRAVTERNIRVVYFRPFKDMKVTYVTDLKPYEDLFTRFESRIAVHGMYLGQPQAFEYHSTSLLYIFLMGAGLLVMGIFILRWAYPLKDLLEWILFVGGLLGIGGALFVAPNLATTILGLLASIIVPTISILILIEFARDRLTSSKVSTFKDIVIASIGLLVGTVVIAIIGGLYIGGMMSTTEYMLELSYFRGVKISQMLPMVIFVVAYLLRFGYGRSVNELRDQDWFYKDVIRLMNTNIRIIAIVLLGVFGAVGYYYIARTGHETSVQVSGIEIMFRNFLEVAVMARPRTKEFLMAFPAVMLTVFLSARGYKLLVFPMGLAATISYTSVANTFSHLRTPIYLSLIRTGISLGFGILVGLLGLIIFLGLDKLYTAFIGRHTYE